jgi:hypothetical protein
MVIKQLSAAPKSKKLSFFEIGQMSPDQAIGEWRELTGTGSAVFSDAELLAFMGDGQGISFNFPSPIDPENGDLTYRWVIKP